MPAITNKQQLLTHAQTALKKRFPLPTAEPDGPPRPLLGLCTLRWIDRVLSR